MTEDITHNEWNTLLGIAILGGLLFLLAISSRQQATTKSVLQKQDIMQGWKPTPIPRVDDLVISLPVTQQPTQQHTQQYPVPIQPVQSSSPTTRYSPIVPYETMSTATQIESLTAKIEQLTKYIDIQAKQAEQSVKQMEPIHTTVVQQPTPTSTIASATGTAYKNKEKWKIIRDKNGDIEGIEVMRDANIDSK
jgi:hypothetical protein